MATQPPPPPPFLVSTTCPCLPVPRWPSGSGPVVGRLGPPTPPFKHCACVMGRGLAHWLIVPHPHIHRAMPLDHIQDKMANLSVVTKEERGLILPGLVTVRGTSPPMDDEPRARQGTRRGCLLTHVPFIHIYSDCGPWAPKPGDAGQARHLRPRHLRGARTQDQGTSPATHTHTLSPTKQPTHLPTSPRRWLTTTKTPSTPRTSFLRRAWRKTHLSRWR